MCTQWIQGQEAKSLTREQRWDLLSPYLLQHGGGCMGYSTLQDGLSHLIIDGVGYASFLRSVHGLLASREMRIVVGEPVSAPGRYGDFLDALCGLDGGVTVFLQTQSAFASVASQRGLRVNEFGLETELDLPAFSLAGKSRAQLRHWINKATKEGVEVFEKRMSEMAQAEVASVSEDWLSRKGGRELRLLTRPLVMAEEPGVRCFWARRAGRLIGMIIFDPMYEDGAVAGYYHNHIRTAADAPHGTADLITIRAAERFREEGARRMSLGLSPLAEI